MAQSLLERAPSDPSEPPHPHYIQPSWCKCGKCTIMDTDEENICCKRQSCITLYRHFFNICLDQQVLVVAIHQRSDIRAETICYSPESFRKAAYRQYILWKYKKLGRGNRRVCPSCVVNCIREWYPSPNGQYMGFRAQ